MEITVPRLTRFEAGNFKGFASAVLDLGDGVKITINSLGIKEWTKDGETKLIVTPPQQQSKKDQKYYDMVHVDGQLWWDITNAVLAKFNGEEDTTTTSDVSGTPGAAKAAMMEKKPTPANKNPFRN